MKRLSTQRAALQDSRIYQLLRKLRASDPRLHDNAPIAVALADHAKVLPSLAEPGLDENVFREPADSAWAQAWAVTERLLVAMHRETWAHGATFLVAVLSSPGTVYPDSGLRRRYAEFLGTATLFYPETRIQKLGEQHKFDVVALGLEMQRYADATHTYLHGFPNSKLGFGHWNLAGHALAATLIAQHLCAR